MSLWVWLPLQMWSSGMHSRWTRVLASHLTTCHWPDTWLWPRPLLCNPHHTCTLLGPEQTNICHFWKDQMFSMYFPLSRMSDVGFRWNIWTNARFLTTSHINPSILVLQILCSTYLEVSASVRHLAVVWVGQLRALPLLPDTRDTWHERSPHSRSSYLIQDMPHRPSQRQSFRSFWQSRSWNKLFLRAPPSIHHQRQGDDDVTSSRWPSISLNSQYLNTLSDAGHARSRDIKFIPRWAVSFPEWWIIIVISHLTMSRVLCYLSTSLGNFWPSPNVLLCDRSKDMINPNIIMFQLREGYLIRETPDSDCGHFCQTYSAYPHWL